MHSKRARLGLLKGPISVSTRVLYGWFSKLGFVRVRYYFADLSTLPANPGHSIEPLATIVGSTLRRRHRLKPKNNRVGSKYQDLLSKLFGFSPGVYIVCVLGA